MDRVRFDTGSVHRNASHREAAQRRQRLAVDVSPRYRVPTDRKPRSGESERHESIRHIARFAGRLLVVVDESVRPLSPLRG